VLRNGGESTFIDTITVSRFGGPPQLGPLVHFGFDSNETDHQAAHVADNLTAGSFGGGEGVTMPLTTTAVKESGRSLYISSSGFHSETEALAIEFEHFFFFTVTIEEGYQADFTGLDFYVLRRALDNEGIGAPQAFALFSSADDYMTRLRTG